MNNLRSHAPGERIKGGKELVLTLSVRLFRAGFYGQA